MQRWIEEARLGDQIAWEQIVQHFSGMAFSVAFTKLGDWSIVEDAVQEAFTELLPISISYRKQRRSLDGSRSLSNANVIAFCAGRSTR